MKPVIKWAGGKSQLLNELLPLIPEYKKYYEPFFGGGALFFALEPKKAIINDYNLQLMNLYSQIKNNLPYLKRNLIQLEKNHKNSNEYFFKMRDKFNKCLRNNEFSIKSASLFLYMNKTCYNGLYRLNSNGLFNVPSAHRNKVKLFEEDNINNVSKILHHATLTAYDFEKACKTAKRGDFVFFDSPYYNTFDSYQVGGFNEEEHIRLFNLYKKLSKKGVKCLLTNSNEKFITNLYKDYNIKIVKVKRMINCNGDKRTGEEVIITNYD